MEYITLKKQRDGMVAGEAQFRGRKFSGIFADMELAIVWATDLEEYARSGEMNETGETAEC